MHQVGCQQASECCQVCWGAAASADAGRHPGSTRPHARAAHHARATPTLPQGPPPTRSRALPQALVQPTLGKFLASLLCCDVTRVVEQGGLCRSVFSAASRFHFQRRFTRLSFLPFFLPPFFFILHGRLSLLCEVYVQLIGGYIGRMCLHPEKDLYEGTVCTYGFSFVLHTHRIVIVRG